jgi:2-dehydro-3-deoxyphosphooctonate aldolase (KDO 8-P synthase)
VRVIAGPCQHESLEHSLKIAESCYESTVIDRGLQYYFKASFDKANRSSVNGKRGVGLDQTMRDFLAMKEKMPDLEILTDVHERDQIDLIESQYPEAVDVYQIPAFLCRQTDLIQRACATDKIVNIKKGQFLAPWDVKGILSKTEGAKEVWVTERGTSFGYNNLVVDFTGLKYMIDNYDVPVVFDATHSVQKPGGLGESTGGNREYVFPLVRAACAVGCQNTFMEVHDDPDNAPSDGPNMLNLHDFDNACAEILRYTYVD